MPYPANQISYSRNGSGPPVLMLHGNPATRSLWRPLVERLQGQRTLITLDLPGFGATPAPGDRTGYALLNLAGTIIRFADHLGLERFDLVGHSFGGALALCVGAAVPHRLRTLIAVTPMTHLLPPIARLVYLPGMVPVISGLWRITPGAVRRWAIRNWTHVSYGAGYSPERSEEVAREGDRPDLIHAASSLIGQCDYAGYAERLAALQQQAVPPVLLVGCARDRVVPFAHFQRLAELLPRASQFTFDDGGHVVMWQHPDRLAELISGFWAANSASPTGTHTSVAPDNPTDPTP